MTERFVDLVSSQYGSAHRAVHVVGIGVRGIFTPAEGAAAISSAAIFAGTPVPVTVRFSNSVGFPVLPQIPPSDLKADVRGMAVKFFLPDSDPSEGSMDMVAMTMDCFFDTADVFSEFLLVMAPDPVTGVTNGPAVLEWLHEHPNAGFVFEAMTELEKFHELSYVAPVYHGVHTFHYVNAAGVTTPGRFVWVPDEPMTPVAELPANTPVDYLRRDVMARCRQGTGLGFTLQLQHPGVGDDPDILAVPWKSLDKDSQPIAPSVLGHLWASTVVKDQYWDCEALAFNPTRLVPGVEVNANDSIVAARQGAYEESHARRTAVHPKVAVR